MATRRTSRSSRSSRPSSPLQAPRDRPWLWFAVLALATAAAYQPAWHGGVLWDDDAHLTAPMLASWEGLVRIWTDLTATQQYYPVVNTAFWAMNRAWGHDPSGYHAVNILMHASSSWLVAMILRRWRVPGAVVAATIFALHPVHVESVAWMTELKNTLSGVCYLAAIAAYVRFDETRSRSWYAAALVAFLFALGSKTVTATLPAALLVLFWWQRGRIAWRQDVMPLLPLFAVGVAAGVTTAWLEYGWVGAQGGSFDLSPIERVLLAGRAVWFYASKLVWPVDLIFTYPRWSVDASVWWQYLFPIALVLTMGGLWATRSRSRTPLAAALFFCGTLFPALGFVNVFPFRYSFVADHFQYLASLGLIVGIAAGLVLAVRRWRPGVSDVAIAVAVGAPLFVLTFQQSRQYVDSETLFRATLAANPHSHLARNNLAALLLDGPPQGWAEAEVHAIEATRIAPLDAETHNTLGLARQRMARYEDSVRQFREAIRLKPTLAAAHYNLAISMAAMGKLDEAVTAYEASLEIFPNQPDALRHLGNVLAREGRNDEAAGRLRQAARLHPQSADIQMDLANVQHAAGVLPEAIAAYREALRLRPEWGEAYHNLAVALQRAGRLDEAATAFATAARLLGSSSLVHRNFAGLLASMNRVDEAIREFEQALVAPDVQRPAEIHNDMGVLLLRSGRSPAAVPHFEAALRLRPDFAAARDNLVRARREPQDPGTR